MQTIQCGFLIQVTAHTHWWTVWSSELYGAARFFPDDLRKEVALHPGVHKNSIKRSLVATLGTAQMSWWWKELVNGEIMFPGIDPPDWESIVHSKVVMYVVCALLPLCTCCDIRSCVPVGTRLFLCIQVARRGRGKQRKGRVPSVAFTSVFVVGGIVDWVVDVRTWLQHCLYLLLYCSSARRGVCA